MSSENNRYITDCRKWVRDVVIGLNFCPFAKPPMERDQIRFSVSSHNALENNLQFFADELLRLDDDSDTETVLLIFPQGFADFDDYLELLELSQEILTSIGYEGRYQLASFHPDYCFEGCAENAAENFTNRSPWPMLHIIREASVTRAAENYPEVGKIPQRNIIRARELGRDVLQKKLDKTQSDKQSIK